MKYILIIWLALAPILTQAQTRKQRAENFDKVNSAIRRNYVSDSDKMRWSGVAATIAGVAIISLHQFESNEAWKYSIRGSSGWYYKPYLKQSSRPLMIPIGLTFTIGGLATIIRNS